MSHTDDYFVITRDASGEYRWVLRAGNGETIATGEGHTSKRDALRAATRVRADVDEVIDATDETP